MNTTSEDLITEYMEPILRFSLKRLQNIQEAEDLAQEILLHALKGMQVYNIIDFDAWIWRVAHNRYNVYLRQKYIPLETVDDLTQFSDEIPDTLDEIVDSELKAQVFLSLHSLSSMYRDILVQYYVHEKSLKQIAAIYSLHESTVKWRLHSGKEKIRERIENCMANRIYEKINWFVACNGSFSPDRYLNSQVRRAICQAAYEAPVTIDEISLTTGIPAMYIEDEIKVLEYGDALVNRNGRYSTDFILLSKNDSETLFKCFHPLIDKLADEIADILEIKNTVIEEMNLPGVIHGIDKLGYFIIPMLIRKAIEKAREKTGLSLPPFPPRKDGGYGWFIVEEGDEFPPYSSGCNNYYNKKSGGYISWFWIGKYFNKELNMLLNELIKSKMNIIADPKGFYAGDLDEETAAQLLKFSLVSKHESLYKPEFSIFNVDELSRFQDAFGEDVLKLAAIIESLVLTVNEGFKACVPERLHSQIPGVLGGYLNSLVGFLINELQNRNILYSDFEEKILTYNIMYVNSQP